ncbi:MAG: transcription antitermination factor NusB [Arcanobacterium sp.]|nr:transcription antitermination factor NusB [Arcanobacterium sp.]
MSNRRPTHWRPGRHDSDPARLVAFETLMAVELDGAYANIELPHQIRRARLNRQDSAYATNLCYGTLRLQGRWEAIASHCLDGRSLTSLDPEVLVLIRMGIHQLLGLGTPAHAAIYETVTLARNEVGTGISGLVNAVLHRVSERSERQWRDQLIADAGGHINSLQFLSQWFSHPQWIVRAIDEALKANGRTHRELLAVLAADNEPASVKLAARDISVRELRADIERGHMSSAPGSLVDTAVALEGGDPGRVFAVRDARAGVQDEGSQLVARTFTAVPVEGRDELWLDMCAGPGGKTATIAAIAGQRGARVHANELHEHRLDLVEQAIAPWSDIVQLRCGDGRDLAQMEPNTYDRVLVDAPCTGIGALRRRPEARWRKEAGDGVDLAALQGELLAAAWACTRVGGIVMYSTCSPYVRETHAVIRGFLDRYPQARLLDAPSIASGQALTELTGVGGHLQLWQDLHGSDAMYMAIVRKNADTKC